MIRKKGPSSSFRILLLLSAAGLLLGGCSLLARLERLEREGDLLPRDATHNMLGRVAALLRDAGLTLQRQFGAEAHAILEEALDGAEREIASYFGESEASG